MISQRNRIVFATAALVAALVLAAPPPAHAAVRPWSLPAGAAAGAWDRAWSWLASLLPGAPQKPEAPRAKDGALISPGGASLSTSPPAATQTDEGGAVNPDGVK